jgi:hypothetical protein
MNEDYIKRLTQHDADSQAGKLAFDLVFPYEALTSEIVGGASAPPADTRSSGTTNVISPSAGESGLDGLTYTGKTLNGFKEVLTKKGRAAALRANNPGAMWPGPVAKAFGCTKYEQLRDRQRNRIAVFDHPEDGAAAQFALLATSKNYIGKTIQEAISVWSGGNYVSSYLVSIERGSGLKGSDRVTREMLFSPLGIKFCAAKARHELGKVFPLSQQQWEKAQLRARLYVEGKK